MLEIVRFCRSPVKFLILVSLFDNEWFSHHNWLRAWCVFNMCTNFRILEPNNKKKIFIYSTSIFRNHVTILFIDSSHRCFSCCLYRFSDIAWNRSIDEFIWVCSTSPTDLWHFYIQINYYQQASHPVSLPFLGIYRVMSDWYLRNRRSLLLFRFHWSSQLEDLQIFESFLLLQKVLTFNCLMRK